MAAQSKFGIPMLVLAALNWLLPAFCIAQTAPQTTPADIYDRTHSSVVVVIVADKNSKPLAQGSGFIVAKNRIVTNHHVVEGAAEALVVFADGASESVEGVAADSPARDLAVLVVKTGARSPLKIGDELAVRQGDPVYALGAPRGLELSLTNGIVSGFRDVNDQFLVQTTAPIAPGSSGGPLFDSSGRVIGVTTALLSDSPGIYFSIGARDITRLLRTPNLVPTPLSILSQETGSETASAPDSGAEPRANSSTVEPVVPSKSLAPFSTEVWKNLQDGQTYRTHSNEDTLYLESVDDYLARVGDITNCEFSRTPNSASSWTGNCWVRNPKDRSSFESKATITVFSEAQIEGSAEYIPGFVMIPVNSPSLMNGHLVPGESASRGGIRVVTDVTGATVALHGAAGKVLGECQPPCSFHDLFPSPYTVEVQKQGYRSVQITLRVMAGKVWEQTIRLDELSTNVPSADRELPQGMYLTSSPPGADVFIDGRKQPGQTPLTLALAPGNYNLVVRLPGYDAYAGKVQVRDNIQTRLSVELNFRVAWARVDSTPKGAEIFVDGTPTGQTTPARVQVSVGTHTVTIKLNGYLAARSTIQASVGGTVNVEVSLRPE